MPSLQDSFVISQGEELLTGLTVDTNANHLCGRLTELGLQVRGVITAGDRHDEIREAVLLACARADLVICTGGLGPTADDLTAAAVAAAAGIPLAEDPEALAQIEARYASTGRSMAAINAKQALLPVGAVVLENAHGTAPGFALRLGRAWLMCLPGVPREMKPMFERHVAPAVVEGRAGRPLRRHTFRVMGLGESQLQELLGEAVAGFPGVSLGFRTMMPENQVKLVAEPEAPGWDAAIEAVRGLLGEGAFSEEPGEELAAVIGRLLVARRERVALAESCTGGWIAHCFVTEPGSSRWFDRGWVVYSNTAKTQELGVPPETLEVHGAVSEPTAIAMAEGARAAAGTDWAVSVTGVAGPGGGTDAKPVGTVCVAVAGPTGTRVRTLRLARERTTNRRFSTWIAMEMLRRQLLRADREGQKATVESDG